ncbi:MAG TPA: hypothetical protein VF528_15700 [Pyrinomonadaceae bacterium]|jgi:hypothetical protein
MLKKYVSLFLVLLLTNVFLVVPAQARTRTVKQEQTVEEIKIKVAKLGVGAKARATVRMKDGTKIKGYITEARDNDFVIRDRKTNEPHVINYTDVAKVEKNSGHSTARNLALGIGIGAGAVLGILALLIANLD